MGTGPVLGPQLKLDQDQAHSSGPEITRTGTGTGPGDDLGPSHDPGPSTETFSAQSKSFF